MARVLTMTGPYEGHFQSSAPIIHELARSGHEIVWITGRQFKDRVERVGARFFPMPERYDPNGRDVYDYYPELKKKKSVAQIKYWLKHVFLDAAELDIQTIDKVLADFPADALLGDSITFGLYFRAELKGPPAAALALLPSSYPSVDTAPYGMGLLPGKGLLYRLRNTALNRLVHHGLLKDVTAHANRIRRGLGLSPLTEPFMSAMPKRISLIMHLSTRTFEYPRRERPQHYYSIGPIPSLPVADFEPPGWWAKLQEDRPVVLVNQGTVSTQIDDLIIPALEGLKDQDFLVIAVPIKSGEVPNLPDNVVGEPFIPYGNLLPHVDVMVSNAGYGATQTALSHGIPLVVAGDTEDKREVAARVEWSGAGINLRTQHPTPDQVRTAVKAVLDDPKYRRNAERLQQDFQQCHAPSRAVELIEGLIEDELPHLSMATS